MILPALILQTYTNHGSFLVHINVLGNIAVMKRKISRYGAAGQCA